MARNCIVVNLDRCTGCFGCEVACKMENGVALGERWSKVLTVGPVGEYPDMTRYALPTMCQQCENAPCVSVCPTGASYRDEDGVVLVDKEKCIGCMTCEKSCPYGHPVQLDDGLSHKCVLCSDENPEGTPDPTCAKACPVRALREELCGWRSFLRRLGRPELRRVQGAGEVRCGRDPHSAGRG